MHFLGQIFDILWTISEKQTFLIRMLKEWRIFFFKILFLFIRERERERQAERQAEGEAGSIQGAQRGTRSRIPGSGPAWAEGSAKPLSCPQRAALMCCFLKIMRADSV